MPNVYIHVGDCKQINVHTHMHTYTGADTGGVLWVLKHPPSGKLHSTLLQIIQSLNTRSIRSTSVALYVN